MEEIDTKYVAVCPGVTVALGEDEANEKSSPAPVRFAVNEPIEVVTVKTPL